MRNVSQQYKQAITALGRELDVRVTTGGTVYSDVSNLNYYTENEIFKSLMSCLTLSIKDIADINTNIIDKLEIGVKVPFSVDDEGETSEYFEYADYDSFFITEKEFNVERNELELVAYDFMYYTMKKYDGVDDSSIEEISLLDAVYMVCEKCGLSAQGIVFPLSHITIRTAWLNDCNTYRDILDAVCGVACIGFKCDGPVLKVINYSQSAERITPSDMKSLKIGEHIGNYDAVDFVGVVSRIRFPVSAPDTDNKIIVENNPIISGLVDIEDEASLSLVFDRISALDFYAFETVTTGFTYFEVGDKVTAVNLSGAEFPVIIMNINLTVNQGITESFSVDKPQFTISDYSKNEGINAFVVRDHIMQKTFTRADGVTATLKFGYVSGSDNANYIQMIDLGDPEYPYAVTDDGLVECRGVVADFIELRENIFPLWIGADLMDQNASIRFTIPISENTTNGIILVFSSFNTSTNTANNSDFLEFFIPKQMINLQNGRGHQFLLTSGNFQKIARKYLYISDDEIRGYSGNTASGTANGITYDNRSFVLRYVLRC